MGHVEYKVERISHWKDEPETRLDQLVELLYVLAKDGWRVVSVDLMAHGSFRGKKCCRSGLCAKSRSSGEHRFPSFGTQRT